jgi:lysozyme
MAQTEEEFRRLNEQLINSIQDLAGFSAETRKLTAAEKSAADEAAKFQAKLGTAGAAAAAAGKAFVSYTKAIYDGETANKAASQSMTDMAEAAKYAGAFLALLVPGGPLVKGLVAGLGLLTSKLIESGKLVAEQADSIYKSYRELAKAGATGAGAMQDTFDGLQRLGLGVERFNEVIRMVNENAAELADFGGTVNRGKKIFEKSMQDMTDQQRIQMEQMGLDRTAQAEATLEYIKQQRLLTRGTRDQMDTSSTAVMRYVKETDLLTRITGLNRKGQEKLMDDAMRNEAFNATLQQIREEQGEAAAKQVQAALVMAQKAGPETAKQFMASISGFVGSSDEAGQAFMATGGKIAEVTDALRSGQLKNTKDTAVAMNDLFKAYGDTARQFRGQAQMMNYGKTFGSFYEAVKAGQMSIEDLAKAYDEAQQQQKDQLTDPLTRDAAKMENDARAKQIADQKLVNLGMEAFITANSLAAENARKLSEAALAAALALDKLRESTDKKRTQSLETAKKIHEGATQTALEAADQARAVAKDPNATPQEKQAAKQAADQAAAASQQTAREQREAYLREKNQRREQRKAENAAKMGLAAPSSAAPSAPSGGSGAAAPGGGGAAPGGGGQEHVFTGPMGPAAAPGGGGAAPGGGGQEHVFIGPMGPAAAPGGGGAAPGGGGAALTAPGKMGGKFNRMPGASTTPGVSAPSPSPAGGGAASAAPKMQSSKSQEAEKPKAAPQQALPNTHGADSTAAGKKFSGSQPVSDRLLAFIRSKEGFSAKAKWDYAQYSNGYGTKALSPTEEITREEAEKRLRAQVQKTQDFVSQHLDKHGYTYGPNQLEGLASFAYNLGPGGLQQLTGNGTRGWSEIMAMITAYNQAGGEVKEGLVQRRNQELAMLEERFAAAKPGAGKQPGQPGSGKMTPLDQVQQAGLKIRPYGDVYQGGLLTPTAVQVAQAIQQLPEFGMYTGLNDVFHHQKHPRSTHAFGRGLDFTFSKKPSIEEAQDLKRRIGQIAGVKRVLNEYYKPPHGDVNPYTKGDHFHVDAQARYGGVFSGPVSGYPVTLHGNEAVIPLDGGAVPVKFDRSFIADIINSQKERMANTPEAASTAAAVTASANSLTNLIDIMQQTQSSNDALISAMNEMVKAQKNSNDIQNKLLSYAQN